MQAAQHRYRDDPARLRWLDRAGLRSIFLQCQVNAISMIILHKDFEVPTQASLVEHDHMIQALAPHSADHTFNISTLPRTTWRRQHLLDAHRFHLRSRCRRSDRDLAADTGVLYPRERLPASAVPPSPP